MARAKVEQVRCDRCKRLELVPVDENVIRRTAFSLRLHDTVVEFEDLCAKCVDVLPKYIERIKEWNRDGKPLIGEEQIESDDKAPMPKDDNPHSVSEPNPHSASSRKRTK